MGGKRTDAEREAAFWARIDRTTTPDGCWPWRGSADSHGYGKVWWEGRLQGAHRVAWFLATGDWPPPETPLVLHKPLLCHTPSCVRFEHLYAGTQADNMRDRAVDGTDPQLNKTHCAKGHEFTPENTVYRRGQRNCRACGALDRAKRAAHKEV